MFGSSCRNADGFNLREQIDRFGEDGRWQPDAVADLFEQTAVAISKIKILNEVAIAAYSTFIVVLR